MPISHKPKPQPKHGLKTKDDEEQDISLESLTLISNTLMKKGKVVHRCSSQYIGDIVVEELPSKSDGCIVRRMRFLSNLDLEQTEVRLIPTKLDNGDTDLVADSNYLPYMW